MTGCGKRRRGRVTGALWAAAVVAAAAGVGGCMVIAERYAFERQFTDEQAQAIRNGETTKEEILARLGPPAAIGHPDAAATDNVLRRFAGAGGDATGRIVYRYEFSSLGWSELCAYGQFGGGCSPSAPLLRTRNLWILIDEETGRVVDHSVEETERREDGIVVRPWL